MKRLALVLTVLAVLAFPFVRSTINGYTIWWWKTGTLTVDGRPGGFVHRALNHSAVIVTRTDISPHQSYLVALPDRKLLIHCGTWSAPRFFVFPVGDVNPPCWFGAADQKGDDGVFSTLFVQANAVEFTTTSGKHVRATW